MKQIIAALAALLFLAAPARPQGFTWESTVSLPAMAGGGEGHVTSYYMPKMLKQVFPGMHRTTIIRLDKELFITVNDNDKTYSEMTFAEMSSKMAELGSMKSDKLAEMREKMKGLPEDQRKMAEQMMGGMKMSAESEAPLEAVRDPKVETIAGYACSKNTFRRGETDVLSVWTTKELRGYDALAADMRELGARLASIIPMNGKTLAEAYRRVDGFPMKASAGSFTTTVTRVESSTTPAGAFEPPAGFRKVAEKFGNAPSKGRGKHD